MTRAIVFCMNKEDELHVRGRLLQRAFSSVASPRRLQTLINGTMYFEKPNGLLKVYPDGTRHFIANSWYVDINPDEL